MPQAQADEGAEFVIIGSNDPRLEGIKGIATGTEVRFPILSANERFDLIGEREQSEEIALFLRGKSQDERCDHKTLKDRLRLGGAFSLFRLLVFTSWLSVRIPNLGPR